MEWTDRTARSTRRRCESRWVFRHYARQSRRGRDCNAGNPAAFRRVAATAWSGVLLPGAHRLWSGIPFPDWRGRTSSSGTDCLTLLRGKEIEIFHWSFLNFHLSLKAQRGIQWQMEMSNEIWKISGRWIL